MGHSGIEAEFIGYDTSRIFVLAHRPESFNGSCVLICPPFAEEMNKTRRMLSELGNALAARGVAVVIPDLFGTGDSDGDFSDASWGRWLDDLGTAESWIRQKGWRVSGLLGIRLGCVLAAQYARIRAQVVPRTVFWQPVIDGSRALDQFLRVRVAASLMRDEKETIGGLRAKLVSGEVVEVAGYGLAPQLAADLDYAKLSSAFSRYLGNIHWFEVVRADDIPMPVASAKIVAQLTQGGASISQQKVVGEPFWATTEIVCLPDLLNQTVALVDESNHG